MGGICAIIEADGRRVEEADLHAVLAAGTISPGRGAVRVERSDGVALAGGTAAWSNIGATSGGTPSSGGRGDQVLPAPLVLADARLDGRAHLAAALRAALDRSLSGPTLAPAPGLAGAIEHLDEPDLIALAHAIWGDEAPAHLIGDFAYIAWDARRRRLTCVRDALGVRPLHFGRTSDGRGFVVASEARMVAAHPRVAVRLDTAAAFAHLCVRLPEEGRTILHGIAAVAPAHRLEVDLGADPGGALPAVSRRYWSPPTSREHWSDTPETSAMRLRAALDAAVEDRIGPSGPAPVGLLLSGGLDSSSIAALAGEAARAGRLPSGLVAFGYAFRQLVDCDETGPAGRLAARCGFPFVELDVEADWLLQDEAAFRPVLDQPFMAWSSVTRRLLDAAVERGITTLLTGHGGDNVLAGSPLAYASQVLRGRLGFLGEMRRDARRRGLSSALVFWSSALRPLLPVAAARTARRLAGRGPAWRPPPWVAGSAGGGASGGGGGGGGGGASTSVELARDAESRPRDPAVRAARQHALVLGSVGRAVEGYARAAAAFGIDVRHPFLDRRVVEVALSIPPEHHYADGRTKAVLRRAMHGDVPAEILERFDKTDFRPYLDHSLRVASAARIEALLAAPLLARAGLVDARVLAEAYGAYRAGRLPFAGNALWSAITLELWLREHAGAIGLRDRAL